MKTWLDLQRAAQHDPFLHRCCQQIGRLHLEARESLMIETLLALSEERARLHALVVKALELAPSHKTQREILGVSGLELEQ